MESTTARRTRFAQLLVREGFISEQQLKEALQYQETETPHKPLGRTMRRSGIHFKTLLKVALDRYRKHRLLGNVLLRTGGVSGDQLGEALSLQEKTQRRLGQTLLDKRYITKADLAEALSIQLRIPKIVPNIYMVDPVLLSQATPEYYRRHRVVPLSRVVMSGDRNREIVTVLMEDPLDIAAVADLGRIFNAEIQPAVSATMDIEDFLDEIFEPREGYRVATTASDPGIQIVHHQTEEMSQGRNDIPASRVRLEEQNYSIPGPEVQGDAGKGIGKDDRAGVKILSGAKEQGSPRLLKPRRIAAATLALLLLLGGAIATHIWLRPAVVITSLNKPTQRYAAKSERVPVGPGIENDSMGQANDAVKSEAANALQAPQWSGPLTLRGEIAHELNIEMKLVRQGSKLSGSYAYERIGNTIPVRGTIDETGSIVLEEFVKGQKTGIFTGKVVSDARVEGKWSKPGSTKTRDFFLVSTGLRSGDFGHIMTVRLSPLRDDNTP
jgi:hypothetical protein